MTQDFVDFLLLLTGGGCDECAGCKAGGGSGFR